MTVKACKVHLQASFNTQGKCRGCQNHRARIYSQKSKKLAAKILGMECLRCGYNEDPRALVFDHVADDGYKYRRRNGQRAGINIVGQILRNPAKAIETLQVLCANCNQIKAIAGRVSKYVA